MAGSASSSIEIRNLTKRYGSTAVVDHVSVDVATAEFLTLLGPSGCGKTTTLRCIAGFIAPDHGSIRIGGEDVTGVPPYKRHLGMVFQSYALFPHLTVFDNVAFGLQVRRIDRAELSDRVRRTLAMVRLEGFEERLPRQLSGGQQQRVALARALVYEPRVLLLDEPLSNLDAKLRIEMRSEIRSLQRELGVTAVYVTHDQEEALSISDAIMVMNKGRVEQLSSPWDIYNRPQTPFVASFVGTSNLLPAEKTGETSDGTTCIRVADSFELSCPHHLGASDRAFWLVARPESIDLKLEDAPSDGAVRGKILSMTMLGATMRAEVELAGSAKLLVDVAHGGTKPSLKPGDVVTVRFDPERVIAIPRHRA
jgi:spermidine/putrescine ABC transporter ATP-binding subunit